MNDVIVVIGAESKTLSEVGFEVSTARVDISSRDSVHALVETASSLGPVTGIIHASRVTTNGPSLLRCLHSLLSESGRFLPLPNRKINCSIRPNATR